MIRRIFGTVLVAAGLTFMSTSSANAQGSVCIADSAKTQLTACDNKGPAAFNVGAHGKAPQVNFH